MAKRSTASSPPQRAILSASQIKAAIPKLERRLHELEEARIETWNDDIKNELNALHTKVEGTLIETFGPDTSDYKQFEVGKFWYRVSMNMGGTPDHEWIKGYQRAIAGAITKVRTAIEVLRERLADMGETSEGQALQAYQGLELHPDIDFAAGKLYRDGHYASAIEDAVKALNGRVRTRSGVDNLDGTKLMEHVFSPNKTSAEIQ